jgi:hypothetical protein
MRIVEILSQILKHTFHIIDDWIIDDNRLGIRVVDMQLLMLIGAVIFWQWHHGARL